MRPTRALPGFGRTLLLAAVGALACAEEPTTLANRPPVVTLQLPTPLSMFSGGDSIDVAVIATDPDEGALAASALSWWVTLHHGTHTHPYVPLTGGTGGRFGVGRQGHDAVDIFLRIYARAVDDDGLADTTSVDILPNLTSITINSVPAGLEVTLDGQPRTTPVFEPAIVGTTRSVGAALEQTQGPVLYALGGWSDAGAAAHAVTLPSSPLLLTVNYDSIATTNARPSVALSAPATGSVTAVGATVALEATAEDVDGTIAQIEYLANGVSVAVSSVAPFDAVWVPASEGDQLLVAVATDNGGATGESAPRLLTVQAAGAPVVVLDTPVDGTLDIVGSMLIEATATDETSVSAVEFEIDGVPLSADSAAPFSAQLPSTGAYASGVHVVRARARDGDGNVSSWASARVTFGGSVALAAGFTRTTVAAGLASIPTAIVASDDGRLFVAEQTGALRVIKNGALLPTPFVSLGVDASGERGLLGVALDPAFAANGWIYLYYTTTDGGTHNRVSRFTALGDVAAAGSELVLFDLPAAGEARKHNGGAMRFAPDGTLLIAVGDDGTSTNAPDLSSTFGKILRITSGGAIPPDNPFYGITTGARRAIWARGLRNPFSFDIDHVTGRVHINDVGLNTWEEINVGRAGADYGWPATEGPDGEGVHDRPLLAYRHFASPTLFSGYAAVGAAFYRPATLLLGAEYVGDYFFADYVSQWIYRLDAGAGWAPYAFAHVDGPVTGLVVGADGALYVLVGDRVDRIAR